MASDFDRELKNLSFKLKRRLATVIKDQADKLAAEIKEEAPRGPTGKLKESVRVRRGRNTLELVVTAGGEDTTTEIRAGSGQPYDYALAVEFGTSKMPAQPFFNSVYRENRDDIERAIAEAVEDVLNEG